VDAPGVDRRVMSLRRLALTSLVVDLNEEKSPSKETLAAAMKTADVEGQWAASAWGKKIAKQAARKNLTDFDRYKVMVARVKRSALIKKALK
jgi:large subunit ribosomal protein L14e